MRVADCIRDGRRVQALGWAALARGTLEREIVVIVRHGSAHHFEGVNAPVDGGNTRLRTLPRYGHKEAARRACVYVGCGVAIILSMLTIAFDKLSGGILSSKIPRLIFYGEATGLVAFGVCWFTASRVLPGLTTRKERFSPFQ